MQKSNEVLQLVTRRFDLSRVFFIWIGTGYFLSLLFAVGGMLPDLFGPIARAWLPLLYFATMLFIYSSFCIWSIVHFEWLYKLRFVLLWILFVLFLPVVLKEFWFISTIL